MTERSVAYTQSLLRLYQRNRNFLLNSSFLVLLGVALTGITTNNGETSKKESSEVTKKSKKEVHISRESALRLLRAAIPSWKSSTVGYLVAQLFLLVARALLTIEVASLDGKLVGALINKRTKKFMKLLISWMVIGVPAAIVNSLLDLTQSGLAKSLRVNLNNNIMDNYLPSDLDPNYYTLIQLDDTIKDPDQRISTDVARLARAASALPGQLLKPSLDLLLCARELSKSGVGGAEGTLALGLFAHVSTIFLRLFSPPFAKLASERANLEGQLRSAHSKIVSNNEEIAFLRGHERELDFIDTCYYQLERFSKSEYKRRAIHDVAHTFIVKYTWGAAGLVLCSVPVFLNKYLNKPIDESTSASFITNRRLLLSASNSLGRLLQGRRYVAQVIGHATRVSDFQDVLNKIMTHQPLNKNTVTPIPVDEKDNKGVVEFNSEEIGFYDVPLITPANIVLCQSLNFIVKHGQHLLIAGPNGCGKSSLFRILGGLWPVRNGKLVIPGIEDMFYLPQRAYLSKGTLKEQIVYPHTLDQVVKSDQDLIDILKVLKLDDLIDTADENPLDVVRDWGEELSIGAQQRLAMARLYYNCPKFAVLDECTSAVSPLMEQFMYQHAQELGISLLSVAHRPALWHFHNLLLKFDGKGGYYFGELDAKKRLKFEEERLKLEKSLREVEVLKQRLKDLKIAQASQEVKRTLSQRSLMSMNNLHRLTVR